MNDTRASLQASLFAYERLLNTMSAKYVELLEDNEAGKPAPLTQAYLAERVNYLYEMWHYTKTQLDKLPPLAKDCTLPTLSRVSGERSEVSRERDDEGAGDRDDDKTHD